MTGISDDIIEGLVYEDEGPALDFKVEQYPFVKETDTVKSELLKDILAMANSWRREDAYILIGVREVQGSRSIPVGVRSHLDDASLQQFVNTKLNKPLIFSYICKEFESVQLGIIKVPVQERPFFLENSYGKLEESVVYLRRGSSTDIAGLDEVLKMTNADSGHSNIPLKLDMLFGSIEGGKRSKAICEFTSNILRYPNPIPDYRRSRTSYVMSFPNKDYYREVAEYIYQREMLKPINIIIENPTNVVATDVRVVLTIRATEGLYIYEESQLHATPVMTGFNTNIGPGILQLMKQDMEVKRNGEEWEITANLPKVQPDSEVWTNSILYIGATAEMDITVHAEIYADQLERRYTKDLNIRMNVDVSDVSISMLKELSEKL